MQKIIKAYLKFLKEDIGYTGFRYDMVKGFSGSHVADYNDATGVKFSVGEYWDGNPSIINWINSTNKKSAAFDFQFRYNVRDAVGVKDNKIVSSPNWSKLKSDINLMHDPTYRQYAITFVENHDMQYRSADEPLDPLKRDTLAANAYMLAMPGTPCVFQPHWRAYKQEIKSMIEARKLAGITNMSNYTNKMAQTTCFANETTGDKAKLIVVVGNNTKAYTPGADYTQILEGYHYRYYLSKSAETAWCNIPSGEYEAGFKAKLTAVSQNSNAKLVYTTDGTDPTAKSKQVATGNTINIDETCTLKVGLLSNGTVTGILQLYRQDIRAIYHHHICQCRPGNQLGFSHVFLRMEFQRNLYTRLARYCCYSNQNAERKEVVLYGLQNQKQGCYRKHHLQSGKWNRQEADRRLECRQQHQVL